MQMASILKKNPNAKIFAISSSAHQGLTELLRELAAGVLAEASNSGSRPSGPFAFGNSRPEGRAPRADGANSSLRSHVPRGERAAALRNTPSSDASATPADELPTISLSEKQMNDTWKVEKTEDDKFVVTGEKIEKFARRTDMNNYASVNRLRDIMKKLGIRAELTSMGAEPDSIISIAGKEFTLVEDW
ncbi:Obg family GTPase CgtA [Candidatus Saccharibacteria bacterium]|nr:Obg family GTPase CgtA [Candidatus Saccharibacteria bacterium]